MHLKGQRARHNSLTEESESLNFVVMLKKGNKQQFKGKDVKSSCYEFVTLGPVVRKPINANPRLTVKRLISS